MQICNAEIRYGALSTGCSLVSCFHCSHHPTLVVPERKEKNNYLVFMFSGVSLFTSLYAGAPCKGGKRTITESSSFHQLDVSMGSATQGLTFVSFCKD